MTRTTLLAFSALALAACGQQAQVADAPNQQAEQQQAGLDYGMGQATMSQAEFIQAVANTDSFELQASQLATERAEREDVREIAAEVVAANETASREIAQLAPTIDVPAPTPQLDSTQTSALEDLRTAEGESFDDRYLDAQVAAHDNAVRLFEQYTANGEAGPLRDWASATLPTLREHQQRIQALENAT